MSLTGRVRKYHSNFYYVEAEGLLYECMLRGLLKKEGTEVLVGDTVALDSVNADNQTARIAEVLPRQNVITRPKMANVDQVLVVYSLYAPDFDYHQTDRYLTHVELAGLTPALCISKSDLAQNPAECEAIANLYGELNYTILFTSVRQPESVARIRQEISGRISVLAGPSGSGKSSLLNALNASLQLRVGEVSEKIKRGQHTTRHVELLEPFADDPHTLIADTPGFSNLKFNTVLPLQIAQTYRDFNPWRGHCAFSDCLHLDEEGCAVRANLDRIAASRYESYRAMIAEARQYKAELETASQKEEFGYKKMDRKGREALKILRLREKDRDASRRRIKQEVSRLGAEDEDWDGGEHTHLESDNFPL